MHRNHVWSIPHSVNIDPMNEATAMIIGERSFGAFCKKDPILKQFRVQYLWWQAGKNEQTNGF